MGIEYREIYGWTALVLAGLIFLVFAGVRRYRKGYFPYRAKPILTRREYCFYKMLKREADRYGFLICPKVGLKDLLEVTDGKQYMKYFHKISQKHVDFVICDENLRVLFALELDDSFHDTEEARERDWFKDRAFRAAHLPLKRIRDFDERAVRELFK